MHGILKIAVPSLVALMLITSVLLAVLRDQGPGTIERVSVASDGALSGRHSSEPAISADGRFVAFTSRSPDLVPDDTNDLRDVFVHDRVTGATERVSIASDGTEAEFEYPPEVRERLTSGKKGPAPGPPLGFVAPALSADGRYVTFSSNAVNLVPDDTNHQFDVFVHDRQTGVTERVSVASDGSQGSGRGSAISADGRYIAFSSEASNLVADDSNDKDDVFVRDREAGTTERVSVTSDGAEGDGPSRDASISADGRYVAFTSKSSNLTAQETSYSNVFVHDRVAGTTELAGATNAARWFELSPAISADGHHVAFISRKVHLVRNDTNYRHDVFVYDRTTGVTDLVSVASDGTELQTDIDENLGASISADGRYVTFTTVIRPETLGGEPCRHICSKVLIHDRVTKITEPVAVTPSGDDANNGSADAALSANGGTVAFSSDASDLVAGPQNMCGTDYPCQDVYVRARG